ncbi:MAG: NFACT family protein [Ruthenibacterium lactatiformans]
MALDAAALALCAKELSAALADARIDKIFEPTRDEVVLNLRTRTDNPRLFLSARSGSARACLTKETFENPQTPPSFCMLLRKHFTGGRLLEVRTLPDERILFFDFQCTNEMGDTVVNTMAAELMGRYSNLVLVQTKTRQTRRRRKIIDALKRVDFEDSEVRQLLPGRYTLPPQPQKASFLGVSAAGIVAAVSQKELPVAGTHQDNGRRGPGGLPQPRTALSAGGT